MYNLTVKGKFEAAHHLPGHPTCGVVHGHSFQVECEVSGRQLQPDGMLLDFQAIKSTWKKYDHTNLNDVFAYPTAENVSQAIYEELKSLRLGVWVNYVRVWESPDACCMITP